MELAPRATGAATRLGAVAQAPLQPLLDPSDRLYWGYLLGSAVLALCVYAWTTRARPDAWRPAAVLRYLLPRKIWLHRSSLLDMQLAVVKTTAAALMATPVGLSAYGLAVQLVFALDARWGAPAAPAWPAWAVAGVYTLTLFLLWDLVRFLLHWALHRVPVLWEFHKVHHSAEVLTPLTLYRAHPVESLLLATGSAIATGLVTGLFFYWFRGAAVQWTVLGVNACGWLFNMLGGNLRHSHVWLSYGPHVERWLISPAQHQIHHSIDPAHYDRNFGTWLAIWDRLAGSLVTADRVDGRLRYGLVAAERNHDPHRLVSALLGPVAAVFRRLRPRRTAAVLAALVWALLGSVVARAQAPASAPAVATTPAAVTAAVAMMAATAPATTAATVADTATHATNAPTPPMATVVPDAWLEALTKGDRSVVPTVTILGSRNQRARIAGSAHTVGEAALERHAYDDVHQVLAEVPGVYVRGEEGYGLRPNIGLRGASSDRSAKITLMEDGVLLAPAPYAAPAAYYFPLLARIEQIEVFKGPAAIRYGPNTVGGAINLVSRAIPATAQGAVDLSYGSFDQARIDAWWGTSGAHWGVVATASRWASDGFKRIDFSAAPGPARPEADDTGFTKNEATVKLRLNTNPSRSMYHQVELKAGYGDERSNETYLGLTDADFARAPYTRYAASQLGRMQWWRSQLALTYTLAAPRDVDLTVTAYRNDFYRVWRKLDDFAGGPGLRAVLANPDSGAAAVLYAILRGAEDSASSEQELLLGTNERTFISQGVQAVLHWRPQWGRTRHDIEVAARLHGDEIVRDQRQDTYRMQAGTLVPTGAMSRPSGQNTGAARAGAFHVYDEIRLGDWLLAPGTRVEIVRTQFDEHILGTRQIAIDSVVLPGIGVSWQAVPWLTLLAGLHRGFSPVAPGQPDGVDPETALNYEVGMRVAHTRIAAEAIGFVSDYQNLTAQCTQSVGCSEAQSFRQFEGGEVLVAGLESLLKLRHTWGRGSWLEYGGSYTLTRSRFGTTFVARDPIFGAVTEGDELPYVPRHRGSLELAGGVAGWDLSAQVVYQTAMRDTPGQGAIVGTDRIDGYAVLNLATGYRIRERARLYVTVDNATDTVYAVARRPFGLRPGAPLIAVGGAEITF